MSKKPFILCVDDDPEFNTLVQHRFKQLNMEVTTCLEPKEFLTKLTAKEADLCIVDLNIQSPGQGLALIKGIRARLNLKCPILVVSAESDAAIISHALEIGANDYLVKPAHKDSFLKKVSSLLQMQETIPVDHATLKRVPSSEQEIKAFLSFEVLSLHENGLVLRSPHLIRKGTVLTIRGDWVAEIAPLKKQILTTVLQSSVHSATSQFDIEVEFEEQDHELLESVRRYLSSLQTISTS